MKHCHPAAERNKQPILETLEKYIDNTKEGRLLEISSGSGQHVAHMAPNFTKITFQPTEIESSSLRSISQYVSENGSSNINKPHFLDVRNPPETWLEGSIKPISWDYILNINMMHISEWACTLGLFNGCKYYLKPNGLLFTYGPYADNGEITPKSNVDFNASLKYQDPSWGLRDISRELVPLALSLGIHLIHKHDLPANNKLIVWKKVIE